MVEIKVGEVLAVGEAFMAIFRLKGRTFGNSGVSVGVVFTSAFSTWNYRTLFDIGNLNRTLF